MRGTALIYSSHNRGDWIHDHFIVQRALQARGTGNRRVLFLPMSETPQNGSEMERQDFSWGTFRWYFDFYKQYGLEYYPFYWRSQLHPADVEKLWHDLYTSEVVILGGGHSFTGLHRYKNLGVEFAGGEWGKFGRILHERAERGLLTVGYSAGADQLCEHLFRSVYDEPGDNNAFGLVRNTLVKLHHESHDNGELAHAAYRMPSCFVFGLPNDSGLNVDSGVLPSGNQWQIYEFIIDNSWDIPNEQFHVKTRAGALIEHIGPDGGHWSFRGGDHLIRIQSPDGHYNEAWMTHGGGLYHYWSKSPSRYSSISELLASH